MLTVGVGGGHRHRNRLCLSIVFCLNVMFASLMSPSVSVDEAQGGGGGFCCNVWFPVDG